MVLLGLHTAYKEDLQASPAEMVFGTTLRIPGDFFTTTPAAADRTAFVRGLKGLFQAIKPVPASRHVSIQPFCHKELDSCSHVFLRVDSIRKPLEPPYTGPHCIVSRNDNRSFCINVNGTQKTVCIDQLKPAHLEVSDSTSIPATDTKPVSTPTASTTSRCVKFSFPDQ